MQMQCRGGGGQPIRPQGFSPASPAPPPPSFPSPNRPSRKTECGGESRKVGAPRPRGPRDMRLRNCWPARIFLRSVEGKRKGSEEGAGGARGKLLGPYVV